MFCQNQPVLEKRLEDLEEEQKLLEAEKIRELSQLKLEHSSAFDVFKADLENNYEQELLEKLAELRKRLERKFNNEIGDIRKTQQNTHANKFDQEKSIWLKQLESVKKEYRVVFLKCHILG